ncbi:DNA-directed RNA polymerase II subunit RPB9 isoform X1 [Macrotis lagotis]|uniref:DNA-directed RNA polymerase II subunit RPB9 isoform X1 n=1 Tax=Macrotis lagotis TaxID=92651 RepID=UPI003D68A7B5
MLAEGPRPGCSFPAAASSLPLRPHSEKPLPPPPPPPPALQPQSLLWAASPRPLHPSDGEAHPGPPRRLSQSCVTLLQERNSDDQWKRGIDEGHGGLKPTKRTWQEAALGASGSMRGACLLRYGAGWSIWRRTARLPFIPQSRRNRGGPLGADPRPKGRGSVYPIAA